MGPSKGACTPIILNQENQDLLHFQILFESLSIQKMPAAHSLQIFVAIFILALASPLTFASDPSPLQDFCVAINDPKGSVFVNGKFCKDAKLAKADDFYFSGLHIRKTTSNTFGSIVTPLNIAQMPGLHTLGISMVRIEYASNGSLNPPHTHPRASEILVVLEGTLHIGFVTSNPDNRLIYKVLYPGDVFVFPVGLIHFQYNIGNVENTYAVAFAGLCSENPWVITIANAVFGSNPSINADILAKAFNLDRKMVKNLQSKF
ncbi:germin-like protein subfamily 1 member 11 [Gossypium hirsutum]|uniref:Germin-like protein n=1 Tax=Gossypium hirsutum TaxID=3635 RepID=A0ABM2ZDH5_GOSHI|nr:germin-like protein subfamily 1 member 11 [Gossypium hirsutum]